jgi:hypothetical protein
MVIYPVPVAVTQAKVQLVIDETARAPMVRERLSEAATWGTGTLSVATCRADDVSSTNWGWALGCHLNACREEPTDAHSGLGDFDDRDGFDGGAGSGPDV